MFSSAQQYVNTKVADLVVKRSMVFGMGSTEYGQLTINFKQMSPIIDENIVDAKKYSVPLHGIACGVNFSLFLTG